MSNSNKKSNWKLPLIIVVAIVAFATMCVFGVQSAQNKAINLEESVFTADSDIKIQEKRRVDLVYNLADCVKQYDKHESETLVGLADKMSRGSEVEDVQTSISAVAYTYPELQSNANYKQFMTELSTTENLIAQYRENYNKSVKAYNRYVRKFPTRNFLSLTGYEVQEFKQLDYNASVDAPQDLFGDR